MHTVTPSVSITCRICWREQAAACQRTAAQAGDQAELEHIVGSNRQHQRGGLERLLVAIDQPIRDGDKIRFVYVRKPNPFQEDVIAFSTELPKEFDLVSYIDYDKQFEKVFLDALQIVIEPLGWSTTEQSSLEDFFG